MPEEILNKLHTVLYSVSPLASDREQLIEQIGETVWLESLEKILASLPEDKKNEVVALLNANELDKAVELMESTDIDIDAIMTEVATNVMDDVLATDEKTA